MPIDLFSGKSEEWLLSRRDELQLAILRGSTTELTIAGVRTARGAKSSADLERALLQILRSLYNLNPSVYENPDAGAIRRVSPNYVS